jgi:hypothetical protein
VIRSKGDRALLCFADALVTVPADSSRISRFAAWKNGLYACELPMPAAAVVIRTLFSIV